ncbi:MAG: hypothetical protein K0B06_06055 [Brevefilum sp.]|nr:hypothetical protein [Brevefilum sp.]
MKHRLLGLEIANGHGLLILRYIGYVSRETLPGKVGIFEVGLGVTMRVELGCLITL